MCIRDSTRRYSNFLKNQYIEHLDLKKCFDSKSIKLLSNYFDEIFSLSELLFKGIIKLYNKNPDLSKSSVSGYLPPVWILSPVPFPSVPLTFS